MTTVPTQHPVEAERAPRTEPGLPTQPSGELASSGAGCDVLEARRGGWPERIACQEWVRDRHPVLVHVAATAVFWLLLVGVMVALGRLLTEVLVPHAGVGLAERSYNDWLEDHRAPLREDVSWMGSTLSGGVVIPLVVAVTCISLAIKRHWRLAAFFLTAILVEVTAYRAIVELVPRERPDVQRLEDLPLLHSFPSGHVAATVAVYGGLALVLASYFRPLRWRFAALALGVGMPLLVAASRMYRGMHNPTDAFAGLLMGALCVGIAVIVARIVGVVDANRDRGRAALA